MEAVSTINHKKQLSELQFMVSNHINKRNNFNGSSLIQKACDYVLGQIKSGELAPGERVSEAKIAADLKISPIPVREAMAKLQHEGWVDRVPNIGVVVKEISLDEIKELFELREAMETKAIRKIGNTITAEQLSKLKEVLELVESARESKNEEVSREADKHFHRLLIHFAGNAKMEDVFESTLNQASGAFFRLSGDYPFAAKELRKYLKTSDHRHIYEALVNHNAKKAEKLLQNHLLMSYRSVVGIQKFLASLAGEV